MFPTPKPDGTLFPKSKELRVKYQKGERRGNATDRN